MRTSESKDTSNLLNLVWLWFRSPHFGLAAIMMRTSEPATAADGGVETYVNTVRHTLVPTMRAARLMIPALGKDGQARMAAASGKPVLTAKYDWHALRHFYASWCINRRVDGGLELPPKVVQARMGHATIAITMDVYGHLFPRGDDGAELAAAERALLR